jgi:hypothetical protein
MMLNTMVKIVFLINLCIYISFSAAKVSRNPTSTNSLSTKPPLFFDENAVLEKLGDTKFDAVFDCSKLKRAVPGYQATVRFEEGVHRCVDYILAHPELQQEDQEFDAWCDRVIEALEAAKAKI